MNVDQMVALASKPGFARLNRFRVLFGDKVDATTNLRFMFYIEEAVLPGATFSTSEHRIYGPPRMMPYVRTTTNEFPLTFRVGADMFEKVFFDAWHEKIYNYETNNFNYHDNYTTDLVIDVLAGDSEDPSEETVSYSVLIEDAYPLSVQEVPLSMASQDDIMRIIINMSYRRWRMIPPRTSLPKTELELNRERDQLPRDGLIEVFQDRLERIGIDRAASGRILTVGNTVFDNLPKFIR